MATLLWLPSRKPFVRSGGSIDERIAELYAIESGLRGAPAEERQRVRDQKSRPLVEAMHGWLNEQLGRIPGASTLAKAIRYEFAFRWKRRRRTALGDHRDACAAGEIELCRTVAWLTDVIERIVSGRTRQHELETLLPWNWQAAKEAEATETG